MYQTRLMIYLDNEAVARYLETLGDNDDYTMNMAYYLFVIRRNMLKGVSYTDYDESSLWEELDNYRTEVFHNDDSMYVRMSTAVNNLATYFENYVFPKHLDFSSYTFVTYFHSTGLLILEAIDGNFNEPTHGYL